MGSPDKKPVTQLPLGQCWHTTIGATLCQRWPNVSVPTLGRCWHNVGAPPLGQRWANWQIHVGPTSVSWRWPNVRVDVGATLGQRRNASWDVLHSLQCVFVRHALKILWRFCHYLFRKTNTCQSLTVNIDMPIDNGTLLGAKASSVLEMHWSFSNDFELCGLV